MRVTLQQIAEIAGVSRGTVDRALHDRGRVNPLVAENIKKIAKDLGYQPNRAGRALAMSKNPIRIGVILQSYETPFMKAVAKGVKRAKNEIERLGGELIIKNMESIDPQRVIEVMDEMKAQRINGLAVVPMEDDAFRDKVNQFVEEEIMVVTLNSDLSDSFRLCFVGQDSMQSGRTGAGLMGEILGGEGLVSIITGNLSNTALKNRIKGFQEELEQEYPDINVLPPRSCHENDEKGTQIARQQLEEYPDIKGFFITSNGDSGVCKALKEKRLEKEVKVICYDLAEETVEDLKKGIINFSIAQNADLQGYKPVMILFQYLMDGQKPKQDCIYEDIIIKTRNNL